MEQHMIFLVLQCLFMVQLQLLVLTIRFCIYFYFRFIKQCMAEVETAKLLPGDGATADYFGYSVSLYGSTAIVGAYQNDDQGINSGSAYIFTLDSLNNAWTETAKLLPSDGAAGDYFGQSVSIYGSTAIVGAIYNDDQGTDSGSAYIFTLDSLNNAWTETAKLLPGDGATADYFGYSVSLYGSTAIVGAYQNDDQGINSGSAYIFTLDSLNNAWTETAKLLPSDA
eukprot:123348_1